MSSQAIAEAMTISAAEAPCDQARHRVLIAEDDSNVRAIMAEFLESIGCDVSQAADGWRAMDLFHRHAFDLVITDLQMPAMDGLTLLIKIKAVSALTPVVVITGQCEAEIADTEILNVAAAVMYKPFDLLELKTVLDDAFCEKPSAA